MKILLILCNKISEMHKVKEPNFARYDSLADRGNKQVCPFEGKYYE